MDSLIEAQHLTRSFGNHLAVDRVSLQVAAGEIYGLIGPDGAGKTTTLRLLCGALLPGPAPKTGDKNQPARINIAGCDMLRRPEQARAYIGYLAQRFALYEDLTVMENIRFFAEQRGLSANAWRPRCLEILDFVGLAQFSERRAGQLSGGMKQKLGLAAALVHQPCVLLLDEPTTGVDPVTRQDFWRLIIHLVGENHQSGRGTAVLVSTPYMDEAARCSRIGFMQQGRLALEGTPAELCSRLNGRVIELVGQPLMALRRRVELDPEVEDVQMFGDRLHLRIGENRLQTLLDRLSRLQSEPDLQISQLRPIQPQLEDVFMSILASPQQAKA
jgi:ABC-2 type transport system ATP-binding protein